MDLLLMSGREGDNLLEGIIRAIVFEEEARVSFYFLITAAEDFFSRVRGRFSSVLLLLWYCRSPMNYLELLSGDS